MKYCIMICLFFYSSLVLADPSRNRGQLTETLGQIIQTLGSKDFQLQITEADRNKIKRTGSEFEIAKSVRLKALLNLPIIMKETVVRRVLKSGKPYGFRISKIQTGSILHSLGIKEGDVLRAVEGRKVTSEKEVMEVFEAVKMKDDINVLIERKNKNLSYIYKFV